MDKLKKLEAIKKLTDTIQQAQCRLATFADSPITPAVDYALQCYITGEPVNVSEMFVHDVVESALSEVKS